MIVKQNSNILQLLKLKKKQIKRAQNLLVGITDHCSNTHNILCCRTYIAEKLDKSPFDFILFIAIAKLAKSTSMTSC